MEKRGLYVIFIGMLLASVSLRSESNHLCKVFHHKLTGSKQAMRDGLSLEVGKVVFYFSQEPEITLVSDKLTGRQKKEMVLFLPMTLISNGSCLHDLQQLEKEGNGLYSLSFSSVKHPVVGLRCTINYDPGKIDVAYDTFDVIRLYKGLAFTFYDKELLKTMKDQSEPLIRMTANKHKVGRVIIDCGHGGEDSGASGYGDLAEKDITLLVGNKLSDLLADKGFEVALTRTSDRYMRLDERTKLSAEKPLDSVFVSLHVNYSNNDKVAGIETFCLSPPLLKNHFKTLKGRYNLYVESLLLDRYKKGNKLAHCLHSSIISTAGKYNTVFKDRHIKNAVSQVLLGSVVPSALIELGFLSNKDEGLLLQSSSYQSLLAQSICAGVLDYFKSTSL